MRQIGPKIKAILDQDWATSIEIVDESVDPAPGSRQCQTFVVHGKYTGTPNWLRRYREFLERCPEKATLLIMVDCPNRHENLEEVCDEHAHPSNTNLCSGCAANGLFVPNTLTVIGRI